MSLVNVLLNITDFVFELIASLAIPVVMIHQILTSFNPDVNHYSVTYLPRCRMSSAFKSFYYSGYYDISARLS